MPDMPIRHANKLLPCRVCGSGVEVGVRTRKAPRCLDCGLDAAIEAARQMHAKSGPLYDKWLARPNKGGRPMRRGTPLEKAQTGVRPTL